MTTPIPRPSAPSSIVRSSIEVEFGLPPVGAPGRYPRRTKHEPRVGVIAIEGDLR
jgi:hypothetical protein